LSAGYQYDVFLSYSRAQQWPTWVERTFLPIVEHWLSAELGRDVRIFHDMRSISIGQHWPNELEYGLAASRIMITLWSRSYFRSDWCRRELGALMCRAEHQRSRGLTGQIIFPIAIHDSTRADVPSAARDLQLQKIQQFADPFIHQDSPMREELSRNLRPLCQQAARQIAAVPDESYVWPLPDYSDFVRRLTSPPDEQTFPPSLGGAQ
jgi:hypothetical protein